MQPTEVLNKLLSVLQIVEDQKCDYASRLQSANQIICQKTTELLRTQALLNLVHRELHETKEVLNLEIAAREVSTQIISQKDNQLKEKQQMLEKERIEKKDTKELLLHTLNKCSPNPKAFVFLHFLDKPHLASFQKNITTALENSEPELLDQMPLPPPPPPLVRPPLAPTRRNHVILTRKKHNKLLQYKGKVRRIEKHLNKEKYCGTHLSKEIFSTAFAHVPAASSSAREILISASVYAFLKDV